MADPTIRARLTLDTTGYQKGAQQAVKSTSSFSQIKNTMVGVFGGNLMTAAAQKTKDFFVGAVQGAANAEQANTRFGTTLSNLGFAKQVGPAQQFLSTLSRQAAVSKGELRPVFETMLRTTHDYGKAQQATALAVDVAAGSGRNLNQVALAMGRAFNGSTQGLARMGIKTTAMVPNLKAVQTAQQGVAKAQVAYTAAVNKYGPSSDQAHAAMVRLGGAQDKLKAAQDSTKKSTLGVDAVMKNLATTFGGQASKQANTAAGRMKNAQIQFHEFQITVGQALLPAVSALLGVFQQFMPVLQGFANWAKQNPTALKLIAGLILAIAVAVKGWQIAQAIWNATVGISNVVMTIFNATLWANPITWIIIAIIAFVAILVVLQMKFGILTTALSFLWSAFKVAFGFIISIAQAVFNFFVSHWPLLIAILLGPIGIVALLIIKNFNTIKAAAQVFVNGVIAVFNFLKGPIIAVVNALIAIWNGFTAFLRGAIGIVRSIASAIGNAFGVIGSIIGGIINGAKTVISGFVGFIQGIVGTVGRVAGSIVNAIKAPINAVIGGLNAIQVNIGPWTLPSVSLPKFLGGGTLGGNTIGPWHFGFPHITPLQTGGLVTGEGLFHLHPGEAVTPAPMVARGAPLVNIENAYFGDAVDVDTFMDRVAWHATKANA